ncbi:indolepyruvate ferredoxin oxidoreductase family protein [Actinomycetospora straminea]|uniref:Indolepyruvate ferredoxin oxidoreductase family protein n=1 Tax=Actinomycetospora straminea TaxID=663607 RepID=A0ABP9FAQ9_9PSEU|nr:indolepyruvate ferredoxin oxidoreductase family protein [Actinomycetospora straminea]MDD7936094.1 indolepyruvate ferredoxin oxidoreductase family protein [Actinomycetospora straminea]
MTVDVRPPVFDVPSGGPGEPRRPVSLRDRYAMTHGRVHLTGVQALVRLPLDQHRADRAAGLRTGGYVSGYEGSPLAGYDLELARNRDLLDEHDVVFAPGLNEEIALTAVEGTQLAAATGSLTRDGVVGYWYGKAPGLDRATDALRHANLTGTHPRGGAVAFVGDDPAAKSSSVPSASEAALADMAVPVLYPADSQDVLDLGRHAVALSRVSGLWTALKMVTAVADGSGTVEVDPDRLLPVVPDTVIDGRPWVHTPSAVLLQPSLGPIERDLYRARLELARRYAAANGLDRIVGAGPARIGVVAAGKSWLDLRQALDTLGLDDAELARRGVRLLRVGMPWPLDHGVVDRFAAGLDEIVVVEEKRAFLETQIKDRLYGRPDAPRVHGKRGPDGAAMFPEAGDLDPDVVARRLGERLLAHGDVPSVRAWRDEKARRSRIDLSLTPVDGAKRTPFYCSGCPHNTSTTAIPDGSLVGAGIGCHTMVLLMPEEQVGEVTGLTQMGGEGAHWLGMAPFVDADHYVQNIGDGTFHHSGSLAVRAAVAAGAHMTFRLLHNGAAAMTGGQDAVGALSMPALTQSLAAEGVTRILVTTEDRSRYRGVELAKGVEVWDRSRYSEAQRVLADTPGVTVLIHDQECAAQKRRKRKRGTLADPSTRVMINERVCEGCGDCGQTSNCLSVTPVDTEFGRKTRIHQASCNKDYSCLDGDCPAFLAVEPGTAGHAPALEPLGADVLPTPPAVVDDESFTVRLAGIGGTGVTTVSQVLATAALVAGRHVRGLDQTGLAQKGGAVVSDVKVSRRPGEAAGRAAEGECDLYLGADLLVAADPANLATCASWRTVAAVSSAKIATGSMVVDPSVSFPDADAVLRRITDRVRRDVGIVVDARALADALFGDDQFALTFLLGAAFQAGALPLPASAVEEAFTLNGAAVEKNLQAFRRGRQSVADPEAFAAVVARVTGTGPDTGVPGLTARGAAEAAEIVASIGAPAGSELERLVAIRVPELVAYQDADYARSYASVVRSASDADPRLAEAIATGLYKLMAYKDEYEVARLSLDPALEASVRAQFGEGARHAWKLHPPVLRAAGMQRKITLGRWFRPGFRTLRAMRRLRGTRLDPFGVAEVRRVERELVAEYRALVPTLMELDVDRAVEIAALPDMVRGYEDIKLANVARYRARLAELLP